MKVGENMFQMTLNKHAKFHGDRTIGSAITVKKASKHSISKVNDLKSMQYYSLDTLDQLLSKKQFNMCVCVFLWACCPFSMCFTVTYESRLA